MSCFESMSVVSYCHFGPLGLRPLRWCSRHESLSLWESRALRPGEGLPEHVATPASAEQIPSPAVQTSDPPAAQEGDFIDAC